MGSVYTMTDVNIAERVTALEKEVRKLQEVVFGKPKAKQSEEKKMISCDLCNTTCRTEARLRNHMESNHKFVRAEAESTSNSRVVVKTTKPFLEGRSKSMSLSRKRSTTTSSTAATRRNSPLLEDTLSLMLQSLNDISRRLRVEPKATDGPSLDIEQS